MRLAAAIESMAATTTGFRAQVFGDEWRVIWATRNRIAHGYARIDMQVISLTVEHDLPAFERKLRSAVERRQPSDSE